MNKESLSKNEQIIQLLNTFAQEQFLSSAFTSSALKWFIPVIDDILSHQKSASHALMVGVNGSQGSGKSTFCALATRVINQLSDKTAVALSLDDFYYSSQYRSVLASDTHNLLATRGVPGTHDTDFIKRTLSMLKNGEACLLPRFDKASDNPSPKHSWQQVTTAPDIIFFEGWCWGVNAQTNSQLLPAVSHFEITRDAFTIWRTFVNNCIKNEYEPLYDFFNYWVMLKAPSFDAVYDWRCEQEHKLRQANPDAARTMSDEQIYDFIQHYQRITSHCLETLPSKCDVVFELSHAREITGVKKRDV